MNMECSSHVTCEDTLPACMTIACGRTYDILEHVSSMSFDPCIMNASDFQRINLMNPEGDEYQESTNYHFEIT
jgi:hypothetical protein